MPGEVRNPTATTDGDSVLVVLWDALSDSNGVAITVYRNAGASNSMFRTATTGGAESAPGPPTSLTAKATTNFSIGLLWTAPTDTGTSAITGYKVEVSSDSTTWTVARQNTNTTNTNWTHSVISDTTLYYRVSAINGTGAGSPSNVARTSTPGAPRAPNFTRIAADGASAIDLVWRAPADTGTSAITGYKIEVSEIGFPGTFTALEANTMSTDTAYKHTGLNPGSTRYYQIRAINNAGEGPPSTWRGVTTASGVTPGPPTSLMATALGDTAMHLSWTAPTDTGTSAVSGYEIEMSRDEGVNWVSLGTHSSDPPPLSYTHKGLTPDTTLHYRVRAVNEVGPGPPSNVVMTMWPPGPPRLVAVGVGDTAIDLSWTTPVSSGSSAITAYKIEVSSDSGANWADLVANTMSTDTTYRHGGLDPGTTRQYRVSAINDSGAGAPSNVATATTGVTPPGPPANLVATASGDTVIDLSWSAPADSGRSVSIGYRIEESSDAGTTWNSLAVTNGTTFRERGLTADTTLHYRVFARNSAGEGPPSNVASATTDPPAGAPGPPVGLGAAADGDTAIDLSWTAPSDTGTSAVRGYRIEMSNDAGTSWTILVANTTATTYKHTGLDPGTTRYYRVRAINGTGAGAPSNVARATTGVAVGAPGPPTNLGATASGDTAIDLSWTAPSDTGTSAVSGYRIEVSSDAGASWTNLVANTGSTAVTYKHRGLAAGTTRHYRVSAVNAAGPGAPSNMASATTTGTSARVPGPPANLSAAADGDSVINLSWTTPTDTGTSAISGYRIEVSANAGSSWSNLVSNTNSTATTYRHAGLSGGMTRHYRVSAINAVGTGGPSNTANATTGVVAKAPGAPTDLEADAADDHVDLDWEAPASDGGSAITGYRIEYSTDGDDWDDLEEDTETTSTRYRHRGVEPGTRYYYRVRAINAVGESEPSNEASATTEAGVPGAPTDLEADADGPTEVELDWEAPADDGGSPVTGYRIEYSENGDDWDDLEEDTESSATRYVHRGASAGTRYYYRVRAINAAGESEPSNEASATTETSEPDAPTGLMARAVDEGRIDLSWTAPEFDGGSAVTGYRIEVSYGDVNWQVLTENTQSTATTYTHTGLDPNTEATYRVAAVNAQGHGAYSNTATARTDATVATAPRGLNARPVGTDRIDLSWTPPLDDGGTEIEGYRILVAGPAGGFTVLVNHTGTTATTYSHTGLDPGTSQRYQVQAINDAGVGPSSNIASARTDPVVPDAPVNLVAGAQGSNAIVVTWEPPAYTGGVEVTGYRIEVHDGTAWTVLVDDHGLSTTYTHTGLLPGDERRYRVYALNEAGTSEASNVAVAATDPVIPDPPSELEAKANGPYRIDLEWRAPRYDGGADITGYRIHVLADGESEWRVLEEDTRTDETRYAHTGLEPATENRYRVAAINAAGVSHLSAAAMARTDPVVPDPPENLRAEANGPYRIDLEWDEPSYTGGVPVTGYRVEAYDGTHWTVLVADTRSGETSRSHTGLDPGSEWSYRVSAINEAGTGEPSEMATAVTDPIPPDPPIGLEAEADGAYRIRLEWIAPAYTGGAPITGYRIEGSRGDAVWTVVAETETVLTSYVHRGLEPASTWYYRVSAVNRAGASLPSEMAVATTDPVRPDPPTGLRAEAQGAYRIDLSWAPPAYTGGAPLTGYQVEVSENAGASWDVLVTDTRSLATAYQHTGIRPGSTRHYRVSAINRAGVSDPSPVAFAKTEATVPDAPEKLRAVAIDHERVGLSWAAPPFDGGAPVTGYRIQYSEDGGVTWEYADEDTQSGKTEHVHGGLRPATTYHYRIAAINEKGAGAATDPVSVRTDATVPDAPTDLVAEAATPRRITLTWEAPAYDGGAAVTSYRVEVSMDGEEWEVLDDTDGAETEYAHDGLAPGDTRHYRVSATNEAGTGEPSNVATATTDDPVERAARVNAAILPRFASAVTAGIVEAIGVRVQAVAGGAAGDQLRAGSLMAARTGGLRAVLGGSSAARSFGGVSTWVSAGSVTQAAAGGSSVQFEGGLFSAHAGADMRLPHNLLAGLAVSRSSGAYDWTDMTGGRNVAGTYEARLTSITPYAAWTPGGRASVWTAASYGRGNVEIDDALAGTRESKTTLRTGAAGVTGRLLGNGSGALNVRAEGWASWMDLAEADGIDAMDFQIRRIRAVLEWTQLNRFEGGHEAGLLVSGGARYELNEGVDDVNGMEVGGGLRYTSPARRLRMQGQGRLLLATGSDYEEWGIGATVQIDPGAEGGLSLRLNPSYGRAESGVEALWSSGVAPGMPGMEPGRAKFTIHTEYQFSSAAPAMPALKPVPYARAELFGPARGLWLGTRIQWLALEGTYDRNGPALSAKGAWQW